MNKILNNKKKKLKRYKNNKKNYNKSLNKKIILSN